MEPKIAERILFKIKIKREYCDGTPKADNLGTVIIKKPIVKEKREYSGIFAI